MFSRNRLIAGASAVALAAGTTLTGVGAAGAQGSSEIAADLQLAATALNGPVSVSSNTEGGPTVGYANDTGADQQCVGFTMPYSTIEEKGIDPSGLDLSDLDAALGLIASIEAEGGVSVLTADEAGEPTAYDSAEDNGGVVAAVAPLILGEDGVSVPDGELVEWTATSPDTPAAGVVLCVPDPDGELIGVEFGIYPQVVADQINGKIPGGSVEPVSAGSISGGSVNAGATVLGSLTSASGGGDVEEPVDPPVEEPAE